MLRSRVLPPIMEERQAVLQCLILIPFVIAKELTEWKKLTHKGQEQPRSAGVSSFGAGGANAHIVLEERDTTEHAKTEYKAEHGE